MNIQASKELKTEEFDFELSDAKIPKYPLDKRDQSKLLVFDGTKIENLRFTDLGNVLQAGDRLVVNNTKVIKARLYFTKSTGKQFEIFCLEPSSGLDPAIALSSKNESTWNCLVRGSKKWGDESLSLNINVSPELSFKVEAKKIAKTNDGLSVQFTWDNSDFCFADILTFSGAIPIPPYLNREADQSDEQRYQTVYALFQGSVAAPTAGLHFTPELLSTLKNKGVEITEITLHVGAGTFRPVKDDVITDHEMHEELISVPLEAIEDLLQTRGRIIPVGTTSMRTLESIANMSILMQQGKPNWRILGQWDYKEFSESPLRHDLLLALKQKLISTNEDCLHGKTGIMIVPGYDFKMCDALITNFHQPKSTLTMLVAAFIGEKWKSVYQHALENDYRFLSYGDSSFLIRNKKGV